MNTTKTTQVKELQNKVVSGLSMFADAIGKEDKDKTNTYGFTPGVGLNTEAKLLREKCDEIKQGIFNVLFTGTFNGGKSTLINAVIGKNLLPEAAVPETPTISKIWFGRSEEKATIIYSSDKEKAKLAGKKPGEREVITIKEYQKNLRLKNGIQVESIDHVEIEQTETVFENLAQFVDSLGLDSAAKEDQITKEYEAKANAVVFLINATEPLKASEVDRIASKYYKKQLKNVFFVVTRIDCLRPVDVEDVKERIYKYTHDVFVDERGVFDERLRDKRVFFVNALGAECVRTNTPFTIGGIEIPIKLSNTGVPEFENALSEFLLSDDKYKEAYNAELPQMRIYFKSFYAETEKRLRLINEGITSAIEKKEVKESEIEKVCGIIQDIRDVCDNFVRETSMSVSRQYMNFTSSVRAGWDEYFEEHASEVEFGAGAAAKLAWYNLKSKINKDDLAYEADVQELTRPITEAIIKTDDKGNVVGGYVGQKLEEFKQFLAKDLEQKMTRKGGFTDKLDKYCNDIDELMKDSDLDMKAILNDVYTVLGKSNVDIGSNGGSIGQALVALILFGDPDIAISALGNKMDVGDLVKKMVLKTVVEYIIAIIVQLFTGIGFIYYIIRVIIAVISIHNSGSKMAKEALLNSKDNVCSELEHQNTGVTAAVSGQLNRNLNNGLRKVFDRLEGKLRDEKDNLDKIIKDLQNNQINSDAEKERFKKIEFIMVKAYNEISSAVNGKTYNTAEEIMRA